MTITVEAGGACYLKQGQEVLFEMSDDFHDVTVLIADDNADMRTYIERLLGAHWEVETVADGQAAIEAIRSGKTKYTNVDGTAELKDAIGERLGERHPEVGDG